MRRVFSFFIFSLLFPSFAHAVDLGCPTFEYAEDITHQIQSPEVIEWKKPGPVGLNFGYSNSTYWVRVNLACLSNINSKNFILEIHYPLQEIEVRWNTPNGWIIKKGGENYRYTEGYPKYRNHLFELPEVLPKFLFLKVSSKTSVQPIISIKTAPITVEYVATSHLSLGLFFGALMLLTIINFILFLWMSEKTYLFYSLFLLFYGLTQAGMNRLTPIYIFPKSEWLNFSAVPLTAGLMFFFFFFFMRYFLECSLRTFWQKTAFYLACALVLSASASPFFISYASSMSTTFWLGLPMFYGLLAIAVFRWAFIRSESKKIAARLFFLSWSPFVIGLTLLIFKTYGLLPSNFITNYGLQVGSCLGSMLFTFALKAKWDALKYQKFDAEKRAAIALESAKRSSDLAELASQVSHDIRSPLAALKIISGNFATLPDAEKTIIRSSIERIQSIASHLLDIERGYRAEATSPHFVSVLIEEIVIEKRVEFFQKESISIDFDITPLKSILLARINPAELKRILSNLINNSVEAITGNGKIRLSVAEHFGEIQISVKDNGSGILPEHIPLLGQRGMSFGKTFGTGMGLFHAKKRIESWGGQLEIESKPNEGTVVKLLLLKAVPPAWFTSKIVLNRGGSLVIFDDENSIHNLWLSRIKGLDSNILTSHFYDSPVFLREYPKNLIGSEVFLIDYDLSEANSNGLDIVESCGISSVTYLVTANHESEAIRKRCEDLGVRIIPKAIVPYIEIETVNRETIQLKTAEVSELSGSYTDPL